MATFPFYIARRYFFSKKSQNAINIISIISVCGVAVGTMALVCVLSVFNGFQGVIEGLFNNFDPQLKVVSSRGKVFHPDSVRSCLPADEVAYVGEVLQEGAMLRYGKKQLPVVLKGVEAGYNHANSIDSILIDGDFRLYDGEFPLALGGIGLAHTIGSGLRAVEPMLFYAPRREKKVNMIHPEDSFNREYAYLHAIFMVQQDKYDNDLVIVPIELTRRLFEYPQEVTALEIKLQPGVDERSFQRRLAAQLGDGFQVLNRYEQQADYFRMMQVEKWITYLILSFILMIAAFNIIASLSMLIIDKRSDIDNLRHLGATNNQVYHIFLWEGWMVSLSGALAGLVLGLVLCWLQQTFGLIRIDADGGEFIISAYPIKIVWSDLLVIFATVVGMGFFASVYPARQLKRQTAGLSGD